MSLIFLCVLSVPVLLCGCSSQEDGIVLDMSDGSENAYEAETGQTAEIMTEVSLLEKEPKMVYVYVCGAVGKSGVYCLKEGSRLYEAVEMAGGLSDDADAACLNMARRVEDGEQVVVLTRDETAGMKASGTYKAGDTADAADDGRVNINTADKEKLTTVSGIGESRAQAIIDYREKNGSFRSIEEIKNVEGIKEGLFSKIKDKIKV